MCHSPFHHIHSHIRALRSRNGISTSESPNLHKLNANLFILIFATVVNSYPNRTITARFVVGIADNVLNAYLGDMVQGGGGDFYIEIEAYYPLKSDINIKMGYQVNYWSPGAGSIFTDGTDKAVLKTGEKSFKVRVHVGTGGWFDGYDGDVNWYFDFTHFSDSSFRYLKGSYNGVGYPS